MFVEGALLQTLFKKIGSAVVFFLNWGGFINRRKGLGDFRLLGYHHMLSRRRLVKQTSFVFLNDFFFGALPHCFLIDVSGVFAAMASGSLFGQMIPPLKVYMSSAISLISLLGVEVRWYLSYTPNIPKQQNEQQGLGCGSGLAA